MKRLIASFGSLSLVLSLQLFAEMEDHIDEPVVESIQLVDDDNMEETDANFDDNQEEDIEQLDNDSISTSTADASPMQESMEDAAEPEVSRPSNEENSSADTSSETIQEEQQNPSTLPQENPSSASDDQASPDLTMGDQDGDKAAEILTSSQEPPSKENLQEVGHDGDSILEELTLEENFEPLVEQQPSSALALSEPSLAAERSQIVISLEQIFRGSPAIYLTLCALSVFSFSLWLYNSLTLSSFRRHRETLLKNIKARLLSNQYDEALELCQIDDSPLSRIVSSAIASRHHGLQFMLESMKSEGKRATIAFWQRLNLIHDIAVIAPMIGLLGTVLGMLYAFYDLNRSLESVSALFDGLGISVGTTVAGIFVAILAMILYSFSKYRLIQSLTYVENQAVAIAHLIDHK